MTPAAAFAKREERKINSQTAEMQGEAMMECVPLPVDGERMPAGR
jgi:hypothetical protein